MLTITIEGLELYDEIENLFSTGDEIILTLEHSLVSVSKWESKHQKSFLSNEKKTPDEVIDYVRCMCDQDLGPDVLKRLSPKNLDEIQAYLDSSQSATTFSELQGRRGPGEVITAELIYYWMVTFNIPLECENWHLNRLFSLIRICGAKSQTPKKMPKHEVAQQYREANARRRRELNTTG